MKKTLITFFCFIILDFIWTLTIKEDVKISIKHEVFHHHFLPNHSYLAKAVDKFPEYKIITNSLGFRDSKIREIDLKKKDRIIFIGDSFIEGVVCESSNNNCPAHLRDMVSKDLEVVNLGSGGMNPADYVDWLENLKIGKEDIVVIALYDNDIHISPRNCSQIIRQKIKYNLYLPSFCKKDSTTKNNIDKSNKTFLNKINNTLKSFKVFQLFKESLINIPGLRKYFYRTNYRDRWTNFQSEENRWITSSIVVMKQIIEAKGGSVHFTYYPNTNNININDPRHDQWLNFVTHLEESKNIYVSDPYPYFIEKANSSSMVWSLTDKHPNCAAHKIMADHIYNELRLNNKI